MNGTAILYKQNTPEELRKAFERDVEFIKQFYDGVEQDTIKNNPDLSHLGIFKVKNELYNRHFDRFLVAYQKRLKKINMSRQ